MREYHGEDHPCCYFHPKEANIVGVCPLCLNERLLILSAKHTSQHSIIRNRNRPKIFAFGSLLNRFEFQHKRFDNSESPQDSFISMKFENNGIASWEKGKVSKVSLDHCRISSNQSSNKETKRVIEHVKPRGLLMWRKRIGRLFRLTKWERPTKWGVCHVGSKVEG
ncbi:RNA polymerase sigma factor RpoD like [Actinidia chinensis var. chinensis]|uniref:RNA polymerase sigma factor RpoD like n=1 Tax=Actinidia chinensis var. chinensis TaxID=1590841 RepID=A0A2R6QYS2_ACTCC|nr:RNA polymerase sigma factor RpoD like [Actinidia chinensis var. chinensis]